MQSKWQSGLTGICILLIFSLLPSLVQAQKKELDKKFQELEKISDNFEILAEYVAPAVVQVFVSGFVPGEGLSAEGLILKRRGTGSGVIVDPTGYIMTNAHVVEGAMAVKVLLSSRLNSNTEGESILKPPGKFVDAKIVGTDAETDLAVLKIEDSNLPFLNLGDSDNLRIGQIVFAFGSPLGLENSVTMGVISSVARQLRPEDPMIYIQTDTPINPGNSGGPLVNTRGEVIGINTLIFSQSGGSEGIGFAAPSNIVKNVYDQIREIGRVRRGQIGVRVQTITPALAAGLNLSRYSGVIISDVFPDGQAYKSGLQIGDIILSLNDKIMENGRQFEVNLYRRRVNEVVVLEILRGSKKEKFWIPVKERDDDENRFLEMVEPDKNLVPELGILAINLEKNVRSLLPPLRKEGGVLVAARSVERPYWGFGLIPGDIIYSVNKKSVEDIGKLRQLLSEYKEGDAIVLEVERRRELIYVAFEME